MKTARELTIYFMRRKNDILFELTGKWLCSKEDMDELENHWTEYQYVTFMDRLMEKRHRIMTLEEKKECVMCFSSSQCLELSCPIDSEAICDGDICPWCVVNPLTCEKCTYNHRNGSCRSNVYQEISQMITHMDRDDLVQNHGIISSIPEIASLYSAVVYDWLTGEELIGDVKDDYP